MFYSNFNGREDFPCKKRISPKSAYEPPIAERVEREEETEDEE